MPWELFPGRRLVCGLCKTYILSDRLGLFQACRAENLEQTNYQTTSVTSVHTLPALPSLEVPGNSGRLVVDW